ncbi:SUMF1/EgtB/PvdO family nonheme iron enzyme [Verrucomicrobiota bacterium]
MKKLFACVLVMLVLVGAAGAWVPSECVWFTWPFAYSFNDGGWYYMNQGDTMYCLRLDTGQWLVLGALDCGLSNGWVYYAWPYGYSWDHGAWYYLNETDEQWCVNLATGAWSLLGHAVATTTAGTTTTTTTTSSSSTTTTAGMGLIPSGSNSGSNPLGAGESYGDCYYPETYSLTVGSFYMDRCEVTKAKWDEVGSWADDHGYDIGPADGSGKAPDHPVLEVSWYECAKWCNARTEYENARQGAGRSVAYYTDSAQGTVYRTGQIDIEDDCVDWSNGYRLPTSEEWEYAARGGAAGNRFPWGGDTISHSQANYYADNYSDYDLSSGGCHPDYDEGEHPYTSPVGSFEAGRNAYGLYDIAGNVWEWCWDWHPCHEASYRVIRGGSWGYAAYYCRVAGRYGSYPDRSSSNIGFRAVLQVSSEPFDKLRAGSSKCVRSCRAPRDAGPTEVP